MSNLPPVISLALLVGVVAAVIWVFAETGRRMSVRGSRSRYVWASAERATRWPALLYLAISAVVEFSVGLAWIGLLDCVGVALWIWVLHEKQKNGDDDDFWGDLKKRLQGWLAGPASAIGGA